MATPAHSCARGHAVPSACKALTKVASTASGTPPNNGNPVASTSNLRKSVHLIPGMPMSRTMAPFCTLALASRKILAHIRSKGFVRRWTNLVRMQDAKWSPSGSNSRQQLRPGQWRGPNSNGHLNRRRSEVIIRVDFKMVSRPNGIAVNQRLAPGPD